MKRLAALGLLLLFGSKAFAQESACPKMQEEALANIIERCAEQEAGTLCFGAPTVTPVLRQPLASAEPFDEPGEAIASANIDWLSLSSEDETWGAARALFPAYPADGLEAREVALLAFGNVALFFPEPGDLPATLADVNVTAAQGANLRAAPNTDAPVIARLALSRDLIASGRLRGGGWLLIYATPDLRGWISESVVSKPLDNLPSLDADADSAPLWLPWHRFDFRSGMHDAPCDGAPESGILLQTVEFSPPRYFVINGARFTLSGTAWLQAQISSGMFIHILDGRGRLSTGEGDVALSSGQFSQVMLARDDEGKLAARAPTQPAAYAYQALSGLPIDALPYATRIGLDLYSVASPAPAGGGSPLTGLAADAPCTFSAVLAGANIRSRPDPAAPIIAVMAYRDSAEPIARGIGADQPALVETGGTHLGARGRHRLRRQLQRPSSDSLPKLSRAQSVP